tara:strand:+ start:483 stop:812 length:330 start_codon:yes stop_codon:yes gene_type:complete
VLALKAQFIGLAQLFKQSASTRLTATDGSTPGTSFNNVILGVVDELYDKLRRSVLVRKNRNRSACSRKGDIEEASLLGIFELLRFREYQIKKRIVCDLAGKSQQVSTGL